MKINAAQQHNLQYEAAESGRQVQDSGTGFSHIMDSLRAETTAANTAAVMPPTTAPLRLPGDYLSSFDIAQPTEADTHAKPQGAAAGPSYTNNTVIDKTSPLYQQALELESYFVKIMLDSMRSGLHKTDITGKDSFAGKMYEDMMYEELSRTVTRNAGLGLADQIYLQLHREP